MEINSAINEAIGRNQKQHIKQCRASLGQPKLVIIWALNSMRIRNLLANLPTVKVLESQQIQQEEAELPYLTMKINKN